MSGRVVWAEGWDAERLEAATSDGRYVAGLKRQSSYTGDLYLGRTVRRRSGYCAKGTCGDVIPCSPRAVHLLLYGSAGTIVQGPWFLGVMIPYDVVGGKVAGKQYTLVARSTTRDSLKRWVTSAIAAWDLIRDDPS